VEDGVAFCPNCGAPQIRISAGILNRPAPPPPEAGDGAEPNAESLSAGVPQPVSERPAWSDAVPGAAAAGALLAAASLIPFAAPLLLMFAAGGFSVLFYTRRSQTRLSPRAAARVGAMGGIFGFLMLVVMMALEISISGGRMIEMLRQAMEERIGPNPNAQAQQMLDMLSTPAGLATVLVIGLAMFLVLVLICSAAGGAIAGSFLGRRKNRNRR
jgi:hypothetical protein